jgi:hypothetical protein
VCSKDASPDLATRLSSAIDDLAAAADSAEETASGEVAARLAQAWALIAEADPELAERASRYSR